MKRRAAWIALAALFCLGVVVTRVVWDGRRALREGDAALRRGDAREAIALWRRAARWYAPGAPHVRAAHDRLEALARDAEAAGDRELALDAWRAVRSSSLATRSFYTPYADRLARANARIAELMADTEVPPDPGETREARRAWHLALLERDEAPSVGWSLLALAGLAAWVGGGFWFARRGLTENDRLDRRQAAIAGTLVVVGLLTWMLALYQA